MTFKIIQSAQECWRAVNAPRLVALVRAGARFESGLLVERDGTVPHDGEFPVQASGPIPLRVDHPARQYFNPHLTAAEERTLLRRNYLLLTAGQAAPGLIGSGIFGIAVEPHLTPSAFASPSPSARPKRKKTSRTSSTTSRRSSAADRPARADPHADRRRPARHGLARTRPRSALCRETA